MPSFGTLGLEQLTPALIQRWLVAHKIEHDARRRITLRTRRCDLHSRTPSDCNYSR
jgi:hypothetical protein